MTDDDLVHVDAVKVVVEDAQRWAKRALEAEAKLAEARAIMEKWMSDDAKSLYREPVGEFWYAMLEWWEAE